MGERRARASGSESRAEKDFGRLNKPVGLVGVGGRSQQTVCCSKFTVGEEVRRARYLGYCGSLGPSMHSGMLIGTTDNHLSILPVARELARLSGARNTTVWESGASLRPDA